MDYQLTTQQQEELNRIKSDAYARVRNQIDRFNKSMDDAVEQNLLKKQADIFDYLSIGSSLTYGVVSGFLNGVVGAVQGINVTMTDAINSSRHIWDAVKVGDTDKALREFGYAKQNFYLSMTEGVSTMLLSLGANIGRPLGLDTDWAYGEDGAVQKVSEYANIERMRALGELTYTEYMEQYYDSSKSAEENREFINDRYFKAQEDWIRGSVSVQNWVEENIVHHMANVSQGALAHATGLTKERADEAFADSELYNASVGMSESVGNILAMMAFAKLGAKYNVNPQVVAQTYFSSSVYGNSFQDAINNGSGIQDAHTYATGNAVLETAIENIGGFTPKKIASMDLYKKLTKGGFRGVVTNALAEGFEEFSATALSDGLEFYNAGIEEKSNEQFYSELFFSALAGTMASLGVGGMGYMRFNTTINAKANDFHEYYKKGVTKDGKEKTLGNIKKKLGAIVNGLNEPNPTGIKYNKRGDQYIGKLTHEEKLKFIKDSGLEFFINEKDGKFELIREINEDMFKNEYHGTVYEDGELAVNDAVFGVDLSLGGVEYMMFTKDLNEVQKKALDYANTLGVPIAFYEGNYGFANAEGMYFERNGVIYVNAKTLTNGNYREVLLRHEMVHKIKTESPKLYNKIEKIVNDFVEVRIDENNKAITHFKDSRIQKLLDGNRMDFSMSIYDSFDDYMKQSNNDKEASFEKVKEEIPAYFIEEMLKGGNFANIISKGRTNIVDAVKKHIFQNKMLNEMAKKDKKTYRKLKRLRNKFNTASKKLVEQKKTVGFFINNVLGKRNLAQQFFTEEIVDKYGLWVTVDDFWDNLNLDNGTTKIGGKTYNYIDVIVPQLDFKQFVAKRLKKPNLDTIRKSFTYEESKNKVYLRLLKSFIDAYPDLNEIDDKTRRQELRKDLNTADYMVDDIKQNKQLTKEQLDLLREIYSVYEYEKEDAKWRRDSSVVFVKSDEVQAMDNAIQNVVRFFKKINFAEFKNNARSKDIPSSANLTYKIKDMANAKEELNALHKQVQVLLDVTYHDPNNRLLGLYTVHSQLYKENEDLYGHGVVWVYPTQKLLDMNMKKIQDKRAKQKAKSELEKKKQDFKFLTDTTVIDEQGNPKVMYHGTPFSFNYFDDNYLGTNTKASDTTLGHFFTDNKRFADRFIKEYNFETPFKGEMREVFLDVKKPIVSPYRLHVSDNMSDKEIFQHTVHYLKEVGRYEDMKSKFMASSSSNLSSFVSDHYFMEKEMYIEDKKALQEKGYDGILLFEMEDLMESADDTPKDIFATIVFSENQIYPVDIEKYNTSLSGKFRVDSTRLLRDMTDFNAQGTGWIDTVTEDQSQNDRWRNDRVIKGVPDFEGKKDIEQMKLALKYYPVVAVTLPARWNAYSTQKQLGDKYKLIHNEFLGMESRRISGKRAQPVKVVGQIWVHGDDKRFEKNIDLRLKSQPPTRHKDFTSKALLTKNDIRNAEDYDFDFAVYKRGNTLDFSQKFTKHSELDSKQSYFLIKSKNEESKAILNSIDFEQLAVRGTDLRKGFTSYDLVDEYKKQKNIIIPKRISNKNTVLTPQQAEYFKDSKVRTEMGRLIEVYHGTYNEFDTFDIERSKSSNMYGKGIYVTDDIRYAERFGIKDSLTKTYLIDIKNPYVTNRYNVASDSYLWEKTVLDYKEIESTFNLGDTNGYVKEKLDRGNIQDLTQYIVNRSDGKFKDQVEVMEYLGYDGIIAGRQYVIYKPEQIKLVSNKRPTTSPIISKRLKKVEDLDEKQRRAIDNVFPEDFLKDFFVIKDGKIKAKNSKVTQAKIINNSVKINNTVYNARDYALNTTVNIADKNILNNNIYGYERPLKRGEMLPYEEALDEFFATTNISYVLYRPKGNNSVGGYQLSNIQQNVVFINTKYLGHDRSWYADVLIHEQTHEMFQQLPFLMGEFASMYADLFFEDKNGKIEKTKIYEMFEAKNGYGNFIRRFNNSYGNKHGYIKIKDIEHLRKLLLDANDSSNKSKLYNQTYYNTMNELTAQITGTMMSDEKIYVEVLKGKSKVMHPMYKIYSRIMSDRTISRSTKGYLKSVLTKFDEAFNKYIVKMKKQFPSEEKYEPKDLNKFIKEFTDGKYTTKGKLMDAYFREKRNKKYGEASQTVDNIIYMSSLLGGTVQNAINKYTKVADEFKEFKTDLETLYNSKDDVLVINDVSKAYKDLSSMLGKKVTELKSPKGNQVSEDFLWEMKDGVETFLDDYKRISDTMIRIFSLYPQQSLEFRVEDILDYLEEATNDVLSGKSISKPMLTGLINYTQYLLDDMKPFKDITKLHKGILGYVSQSIFDERKRDMENLVNTLKTRVDNTKKGVMNQGRQGQARPNQEQSDVIVSIEKAIQIIKDNPNDFNKMKAELNTELRVLRSLIMGSNRLDFDAKKSLLDNHLLKVFAQFARLFNDKSFVTGTFIFDDTNQKSINETANYKKYKILPIDKVVPHFNPKTIASNLSSIIKEFSTNFKTSLSETGESLDDYDIRITEEIRKFKDEDGVIAVPKYDYSQSPQDFFEQTTKMFNGKTTLFDDFWREYLRSEKKMEKIMVEHDKAYKQWKKDHPKAHANSEEYVHNIDPNKLFNMPSFENANTISDVADEVAKLKKVVTKLADEYNAIETDLKALKISISEQKARRDGLPKGDLYWHKENDKYQDLLDERRKLRQQKKTKLAELESARDDVNRMDIPTRLIIKMDEYAKAHINDIKQSIKRGQIVNMYLGVLREIEMHEIAQQGGVDGINPTNHYFFGNGINMFDNEELRKHGFDFARRNTTPFVMTARTREELRDYLESLLNEQDWEAIEFAKERFDRHYEWIDEEYFAKYEVHLPKQSVWVAFTTLTSDVERNWKLQQANRINAGTQDGIVMETKEGTTTELKIENIFGIIETHAKRTGEYSWERLITDWQNLLVNKAGGASLLQYLETSQSPFGADNGIEKSIRTYIINVLQYADLTEGQIPKRIREFQNRFMSATMGLNPSSYVKQFISAFVISVKVGVNLPKILQNTLIGLNPKSKYRKYLLENNDNFYLRSLIGFNPNLQDSINPTFLYQGKNLLDKISRLGSWHIGWADSAVIVGAFKTIADDIRKKNPQMHENDVLAMANEKLYDVLLYGVANSEIAFRTPLSNTKTPAVKEIAKFSSENLMQISGIRTIHTVFKEKWKKSWRRAGELGYTKKWDKFTYAFDNTREERRKYARVLAGVLLSIFLSALVNTKRDEAMGYAEEENKGFDFWVNDIGWEGIVGLHPLANVFTSMIRFDKKTVFEKGFEPRVPVLTELWNIGEALTTLHNGKNTGRKILKIGENISTALGLPLKNGVKIAQMMSNLISGNGGDGALAVGKFLTSKTDTQMFNQAIKNNNRSQINHYVQQVYNDSSVQKEITTLLVNNPDATLKIYNVDTFKTKNEDGSYTEHKIPEEIKTEIYSHIQTALYRLITSSDYQKLGDEDKIKTIQRIINYYYNYMKEIIIEKPKVVDGRVEYRTIDDKDLRDYKKLVERALSYQLNAIEKEEIIERYT